MSSVYLVHHGIKGQKWGVRRYQNEDGTYTAAGKRRYKGSEDYANSKTLQKKGIKNLSNEELATLNERLKLEHDYKTYTAKGESYVKKYLIQAGGKVAGAALTAGAVYVGAKYGSKYLSAKASEITEAAVKAAPNVAKDIAKAAPKVAKSAGVAAAKTAASSLDRAAKTNSKARAVRKGLVAYGRTVDKIIGRR